MEAWKLTAYADGALEGAERDEVERALAAQPELREEVGQMRRAMDEAASLLMREPLHASGVADAMPWHASEAPPRSGSWAFWAAAAALLLGVGLATYSTLSGEDPAPPRPPVTVAKAGEAPPNPTATATAQPRGGAPALVAQEPPDAIVTVRCVPLVDGASTSVMATAGTVSGRVVSGLKRGQAVSVACRWAQGATSRASVLEVAAGHQTVEIREAAPAPAPAPTPVVKPSPPPPPARTKGLGTLAISARPWAKCSVAGRPAGTTPVTVKVPAGRVRVSCRKGSFVRTKSLRVDAGKRTTVVMDMR